MTVRARPSPWTRRQESRGAARGRGGAASGRGCVTNGAARGHGGVVKTVEARSVVVGVQPEPWGSGQDRGGVARAVGAWPGPWGPGQDRGGTTGAVWAWSRP